MGNEWKEEWVPTVCYMCYSCCAIEVRKVNGLPVEIRGNPASPNSQGKVCAKGKAGIMGLYDPYRVKRPLKRTNPEKGLGVDPGWVEISWEEALDTIAQRLKKVRDEDPRQLFCQQTTTGANSWLHEFQLAFGSPNFSAAGGGLHCGDGAHLVGGMMHSSWSLVPDFQHCNYAIHF